MNKIKQTNDEKKEYQKMILNKSENHLLFNTKIADIIIHDYGYSINPNNNRKKKFTFIILIIINIEKLIFLKKKKS